MSADAEVIHLVSHFPGRLRVRADRLRGKGSAEVVRRVEAEPGITRVTAAEVTGSLVVIYDPAAIQIDRILEVILAASGIETLAVEVPQPDACPPGQRLRRACQRLDVRAREAMRGQGDLRTSVPALFLMAGLTQLARGPRVLPRWYELAFWSFVTFINLNPREPEPAPHAP